MKVTTPFLTASIFLPLAVFVGGASSQDDSASQEKISDTLHQMYEAEKRKDLSFVLSHLSDDFAEVAGDGQVYHRSDIEAGWTDESGATSEATVLWAFRILGRRIPDLRSIARQCGAVESSRVHESLK